ncbi:MAG: sugar ABC transporter permease [Chloroflexi bacterium]|nr:sugar ABC transporter permease [Chloroflexota bacterium]
MPGRQPWTRRDLRSLGEALLYLGPSLVLFSAFVFVPLARTLYLSFFYTNPIGNPTTFGGVEQYVALATSPEFLTGLRATFLFVLYSVPLGIAIALVLAVLGNQRLRGINLFRTLMSSTIAVSASVGALMWLLLFNPSLGLLNYLIGSIGLTGPNWLTDPNMAILSLSITTIWLMLGFNIIVLLAGLQGIPEELYESARIDGAMGVNTFRHITIPLLSPSLFFLLVVDAITVFQAFTQVRLLTQGGPVDTTRVLVYSIYLDAFVNFQFGYASAQSMVLFFIILLLTIIQFRFVERRVHYQ